MRLDRTVVLLAAAIPLACGNRGFEEIVTVVPTNVTGSVGGLVIDHATGAGLSALPVRVLAGDGVAPREALTDADGAFSIAGLPAGGALVVQVVGGPPYADAELIVTLPVDAGQTPLAAPEAFVGPIALLPRDLSFALQVVRDDGVPLQADVEVRTSTSWIDHSSGTGVARGWDALSATSANTGIARFDGLANVSLLPPGLGSDVLVFRIPAVDADQDGAFEFEGLTFARAARDVAAGLEVVNVDSEAAALVVVSSNVYGLLGLGGDAVPAVLAAAETVRVTFNQPVDPATLTAVVRDEDGAELAGTSLPAPLPPYTSIEIGPPATGWPAGAEINVDLHATSDENVPGLRYDGGAAFFTEDAAGAPVAAIAARDAVDANLIRVTFTEPVGVSPGSVWSLGGADCVVYIMRDLDMNGNLLGVNETGGPSCNIVFASAEPDPVGLASYSGYTTRAYFYLPVGIASSFAFELRFNRIGTATNRPTTASGALLPDVLMLTVP